MNIYHFFSNHIKDVKKKFTDILSQQYSKNEIEVIFKKLLEYMQINPYDTNTLFNQSELIQLSQYLSDLIKHKPIEYILGYTYFFNLKFFVNKNVLIPRPETEELVFNLKNTISEKYKDTKILKMIDIGTGSACIAVTLKKIFPDLWVDAIDISNDALFAAQKNAEFHNVNIHFFQQDILSQTLQNKYDIIVSNPPYIPITEKNRVADRVKNFEPSLALFSKTPTEFYDRIFELSKIYLNSDGIIFMELNQYYSDSIFNTAKKYSHFKSVEIMKDWSNNDRFIKCTT